MSGIMKQEDQGECSQSFHNLQPYHDPQLFFPAATSDMFLVGGGGGVVSSGGGGGGLFFPDAPPWSLPQVHASYNSNNPNHFSGDHVDPFLLPPPPPAPYGGFFNRRAANSLQFAYDHAPPSDHHLRIITDALGVGSGHGGGGAPFGLQAEMGKMTAPEIMDAKALAASKSHSEAERRRRERINNHLAKLRSLLPSTTKTDKASLLAEVIQHVKELKRQTSLIAETSPIPTEIDELTVDPTDVDEEGRFVVKASLCCEDRTDLLPELIKTLKALRLRTLKAEITTLGGRVKNVLFITGEEEDDSNNHQIGSDHHHHHQQYLISSIQEALKSVMEKANGGSGSGGDDTSSASVKRQRTNNINNILEHRSL